jgi:hypothetical protein
VPEQDEIYVWYERAFVSDAARFQKGRKGMPQLFNGLRPDQMAALLISPPRYCPIHCGLSYGWWCEFPKPTERDGNRHEQENIGER